jgi:hypothetical protein
MRDSDPCESAWTIGTVSSVLVWLELPSDFLALVRTGVLVYPLIRAWDFIAGLVPSFGQEEA